MQRIFWNVLIVIGLVLSSLPAVAAETPLKAIPEDAGVLIRWQKPTETVKKAVEFVTNVDPDTATLLRPLSLGIGVIISNPELAGVDKTRDWYVAVFPKAEGEPGIVFAIPTTDADAMKEGVQGDFTFAAHDDWLLYALDEDLIKKIEEQIDGQGKSISSRIDKESLAAMNRNDISVFLNAPQLRLIYKDELDSAESEFEAELAQLQNVTPPTPGIDLKPMMEMYTKFFKGMMQGVRDTNGVTIGLAVTKESVDLETQARVTADSATDKLLQENETSDLKAIRQLPPGRHAYAGYSGDLAGLATWGTRMSASMYSGDADQKAAIEKASQEMTKLDFGSNVMSLGIVDAETGILRVANILQVKPADKMRDLSREMLGGFDTIEIGPVTQEFDLKIDAEKYGDKSADVLITRQTVDPAQDALQIQTILSRTLYGEEGQVQRTVYGDGQVLQTTGGGREAMEKLLQRQTDRSGDEKSGDAAKFVAVAATRSKLSPQANVVALVDLPLLATDLIQAFIRASGFPLPIDTAALKEQMGEKRSYIGFSVSSSPQTAVVKLHVPVGQAANMTKLVKTLQQMTAQPQL